MSDGDICWAAQANPDGRGSCCCFERAGHDGPHRCCGGADGHVHSWGEAADEDAKSVR